MNFIKMHGLGNDYIYLDITKQKFDNNILKIIPKLCDRHFGIGSDGIILICNSDTADFKMLMYNSDGSSSKMCGNGIRCVGKYVYDNGLTSKKNITIETLAGIKELTLHVDNELVKYVRVSMGNAELRPALIPIIPDIKASNELNINILNKTFLLHCISIGNPHAIAIVDDVDNFEIEKYGPLIENHTFFPEKTNVEFIQILDKYTIKMRVWERGTGETFACGTGSCAAAFICYLNNITNNNVKIKLIGGDLDIYIDENDKKIYMTGTANTCFIGSFDISNYI